MSTLKSNALRLGLIFNSSGPEIKRPTLLFFAADHGFVNDFDDEKDTSRVDTATTADKVYEVLNKTALSSTFTKTHRIHVKVADLGVNHSFEGSLDYWLNHGSRFIPNKIAFGTRDFEFFPAMTTKQCHQAIEYGTQLVHQEKRRECNTIGFTSLSRGGEVSAKLLVYALLKFTYEEIRIQESQVMADWIDKMLKKHPKTHNSLTLLTLYGGFELAAMVGAYLQAASLKMAILVDDFSSCIALWIASIQKPKVLDYCFFSTSAQEGTTHEAVLQELKAEPLLLNEKNAPEGLGFSLAYPMLKNAVILLRNPN